MKKLMICLILISNLELNCIETNAQSTTNTNTWIFNEFLGYSNSGDLDFKLYDGTTTPHSYMQLNQTSNLGFLGLSPNLSSGFIPAYRLDVDSGDINVNIATNGYRIGSGSGSSFVLRHNGIFTNIYVGVGAGNSNITYSNTFIGYNTGKNTGNLITNPTLEGTRNTFVGHAAGESNVWGHELFMTMPDRCLKQLL